MTKIIIPTYKKYNACQLTTDNLDNFKNFILKDAYYDIRVTYKEMKDKNIPIEINFKWNPYQHDYPETICVKNNQWFLYNEEDPDDYDILNSEELSKDWYIYED